MTDAEPRYCNCADPENCREPIPGYICRPRTATQPPSPSLRVEEAPEDELHTGDDEGVDAMTGVLEGLTQALDAISEPTFSIDEVRECIEGALADARIADAALVARVKSASAQADKRQAFEAGFLAGLLAVNQYGFQSETAAVAYAAYLAQTQEPV